MDESKIAPKLMAKLQEPRALEAAAQPLPIIIRYRPDVVRTQRVRARIRARYVYRLTPTVAAVAPGQDVLELTDDETIAYLWLDEQVHTCLDRSLAQVGVNGVWTAGFRGAGIKMAILDTGLDTGHPDFAGRVINGVSFVGGDHRDENGHGTHVAGIAAGSGSSSGGKYRGVAPEASIYVARTLDRDGFGSMSGVMAGIEWAVEQGVHVINLSLGGSGSSDGQDALSLTCNAAVGEGVVVCVAAGNDGPGARTIGSPGAAADAITVGAVDRTDNIARFSARGPTRDGRVKPDICFPGTDMVSARATGTTAGQPVNERYTAISGTSMATPHASGVAALLLQAKPDLSPAQLKQALKQAALDLNLDANTQGDGRGRADQALALALGGEIPPPEPEPPDGGGTPPSTEKGCLPTFLIPLVGR